ncbi:MAG: PilT/PilU family type 4a pilus ATPase [Phascolarctobacterium sp.]|nr:PilT/PilU family type 4a pilus ATPase [Phascolarctobacterium sp.]
MVNDLLVLARALGASDLHLHAGYKARFRINGELVEQSEVPICNKKIIEWIRDVTDEKTQNEFKEKGEIDFAYELHKERYRVNAFKNQQGLSLAIRIISSQLPSCDELGLPKSAVKLTEVNKGLVLVTGPTGSGKSSTLAALIRQINLTRHVHIITLEDPVEYLHENEKALVSQREIGRDTKSFVSGLKAALREDPDVILLGELRDSTTIMAALTAAETGHLVFATLHTSDAVGTISRILDACSVNAGEVRAQLADSLAAVISQKLLPKKGGGRVAAFEILLNTDALRNLIREGRTHQLSSYLATGTKSGMITMQKFIEQLHNSGAIENSSLYLS